MKKITRILENLTDEPEKRMANAGKYLQSMIDYELSGKSDAYSRKNEYSEGVKEQFLGELKKMIEKNPENIDELFLKLLVELFKFKKDNKLEESIKRHLRKL